MAGIEQEFESFQHVKVSHSTIEMQLYRKNADHTEFDIIKDEDVQRNGDC